MIVDKEGSSKNGQHVMVVDTAWNGMVKVDMDGATKSYLETDLKPVPEGFAAEAPMEELKPVAVGSRQDLDFAIDNEATRQLVAGSREFLEAFLASARHTGSVAQDEEYRNTLAQSDQWAKTATFESAEYIAFEKFARHLSTCEDADNKAYSDICKAGVNCYAVCIAGGPVTRVEDLMMEEIVSTVRVKGMPNIRVVVRRMQHEDIAHALELSRSTGEFTAFDRSEPEPEPEPESKAAEQLSALEAELRALKLGALLRRARATEGIDEDAVEAAHDDDDPKSALTRVMLARAAKEVDAVAEQPEPAGSASPIFSLMKERSRSLIETVLSPRGQLSKAGPRRPRALTVDLSSSAVSRRRRASMAAGEGAAARAAVAEQEQEQEQEQEEVLVMAEVEELCSEQLQQKPKDGRRKRFNAGKQKLQEQRAVSFDSGSDSDNSDNSEPSP